MKENEQEEKPYFIQNQEIFDEANKKLEKFLYKTKTKEKIEFNNLRINGKRLFIDGRESIEEKILPFWHLASQGKDELKYDMFQCENHEVKRICVTECDFESDSNFLKEFDRIPCIYRASKIQTFIDIIELFNNNPQDPRIKTWTVKENGGKNLKIRFIDKEQDIDYIIIMKINYTKGMTDISQYRLVTAYPVIMKSYKNRFDKEYNTYLKSRSK